MKKDAATKRILLYLGLTFMITYALEIGLIRPLVLSTDTSKAQIGTSLMAAVMFIPALCVLLTRLLTKEGFHDVWIKPVDFKKTWKYYVMGWFGPAILSVIGAAIYFLVVPGSFDPNATFMETTLKATGANLSTLPMTPATILVIQIATAFLLGPVMNCITCFGEEWGWRGYLLPKMREKFPMAAVLLINGVIWGVWHAPLTCVGHNYGMDYPGFPYLGIFAMCIFCVVVGTFLSYLTIKANSCIPAVLAHGGINSIASAGMYFTKDGGNPFIGPAPTGIIGGSAFIVAAIVLGIWLVREEKKNEQEKSTE